VQICIPPLEDAELLDDVEESCRRLWEASTGSAVAKRYGG
jgi:hypothetical protein